jgi:hypothetical protein
MEDKLIAQSAELFKDEETWNSFIELQKILPKIKNYWIKSFADYLNKYKIENPPTWKYKVKNNGAVWFLANETDEYSSLGIWIENGVFSIWAQTSSFKVDDIKILLQEDRFAPIKNLFPNSEINGGRDGYIIKDPNPFVDESTSPLNDDQFVWLCKDKPEILREQLENKMAEFFTEEITTLIQELNNVTKK